MYCHKCGAENADNTWRCTRCNAELAHEASGAPAEQAGKQIPSHLAFAVLVTVFFLPSPVGLVALYYALHVKAHLMRGDVEKARKASKLALIWCWVAAVAGAAIALYVSKHLLNVVQRVLQQLQLL